MYNHTTTTTVQFTPTTTTINKAETEVTLSLRAAASLALPVDVLRIGSRRIATLERLGITVVSQLVSIPEEEFVKYKGVGRSMILALRRALEQYDLRLGILPSFRQKERNEELQALIASGIDVYCDDDE